MQVPFDPKSGFTVPVTPNAKEIYTCRGEYNGEFDEVSYATAPIQPRMDPEAELLHELLIHYSNPNNSEFTTYLPPSTTEPPPPVTRIPAPPSRPILPPPEKSLVSACTPNFCANNAECIVKDYKAYCVCLENYTGNYYLKLSLNYEIKNMNST